MTNEEVYAMPFAKIYYLLVNKAVRKGRTEAEVQQVICWLTGRTLPQLAEAMAGGCSYGDFFRTAPRMNPQRIRVSGKVCGVQVETIQEPLMRDIRVLDKLIDELAKGRPMEKVLRQGNREQEAE